MAYQVSKQRFGELVEQALGKLPEQFQSFLEEVAIEVTDLPTTSQRRAAGTDAKPLLLGLYTGRPRTERSIEESAYLPDRIFIFQQNIEQVCNSEQQLIEQVRITVLHEIGHHFGLSEEDLDELNYG